MRRILVYDRAGIGKGEINPSDVFSAVLRENINGEHALEITTTQVLEKGTRLLHEDGRGIWREFAVSGIDADHAAGKTVVGDYYCPWSVQEDLMGVTVSVMPGVQIPTSASNALTSLLSSQSRWAKGTVTNTATGGASMYDRSAWEALKVLVDTWGGEVDVTIGVDNITGAVTRAIDLYTKQGNQTAKRRFDFGADANGIVRKLPDEPLFCRISPRGKGEQTDAGGYGRKITIESVNDGKDYLEYSPMVDVAKIPDGPSGYIYPTKIVTNSKMETPTDLKAWAQGILAAECTPKVSYSVDVLQSDEAGTSAQGVSLGDAVQVVDAKFGNGLRIEARVVSMTTDLVAERVTNIELGSAENSISEKFASIGSAVAQMSNTLTTMSTAQYIDELVERINTDINGTGGYTYIVPGEGIICYDVQVADPLIGIEANKVVQIKGGSMRIADTKLSSFSGINDWEWKTVFTSGHIAAELVTAAQLTTGYIGNANGGTYWDLDNNLLNLPATTIMDGTPLENVFQMIETENANMLNDTDAPSLTKVKADADRYIEQGNTSGFTSTIVEITNPPVTGIHYGQHLVKTSGAAMHSVAFYSGTTVPAEPGKKYTMSCYARNAAATSGTIIRLQYGYTVSGTWSYVSHDTEIPNDEKWHRCSWTFTVPSNADSVGIRAYPGGLVNTTGDVYICGWMMQSGENTTAYTVSLSDLEFPSTMIRAYGSGVLVCKQGNTVGALVNSSGSFDVVAVTWSGSTPTAGTVYATYGASARIGPANGTNISLNGQKVLITYVNGSYTSQVFKIDGLKEFTFGDRASGSTIGDGSFSFGWGNTSSGTNSMAIGNGVSATNDTSVAVGSSTKATGANSFAANNGNTASGSYSSAFGVSNTVSGIHGFAAGYYNTASSSNQFVCGRYNSNNSSDLFEVGNGTGTSTRSNAFRVTTVGAAYANSFNPSSDKRVKKPLGDIEETEAVEFINQLKPSKFEKFGRRELGFYAQDVEQTSFGEYLVDESQDYGYEDFRSLSYDGIIAPLVAYCQHLEKRIARLEG